jgi:hypothetical protein
VSRLKRIPYALYTLIAFLSLQSLISFVAFLPLLVPAQLGFISAAIAEKS